MAEPHVIRLRGPWQWIAPEATSQRVKLPLCWEDLPQSSDEAPHEITLGRHFHRPPRMEEGEPVGLVVQTPHELRQISLNGESLSLVDQQDITPWVETRNELRITLCRSADKKEGSPENTSLLDVQLEFASES